MDFYAVKEGNNIGIYTSWEDCRLQVEKFPNAKYKKFKDLEDAVKFIDEDEITIYKYKSNKKLDKSVEKNKSKEKVYLKDEKNLLEDEAVAYVDGSFNKNTKTYSYGVVYFTKEGKRTYSGRENDKELVSMHNVSGELRGAIEAMQIAYDEEIKKLYLHYDYTGIEKWALGEWKANKKGTKRYKEFFREISEKLKVEFIKVPAHEGIKYNEEADRLAKDAL